MRALVIDDATRASVARVIAHAEAHHDERFVAQLGTYRCVFSYTHSDGAVWRHLSISVPSKDYPHPIAAFTIADLFGFTGWDHKTIEPPPREWEIIVQQREHAIVLVQVVRAGALAN